MVKMVDIIRSYGKPRICYQVLLLVLLAVIVLIWSGLRSASEAFDSEQEKFEQWKYGVVQTYRRGHYGHPELDKPSHTLDRSIVTESDLISFLHEYHLEPPSTKPYKIETTGTSEYIDILKKLFGDQKYGFFVEAGANDGVYLSNTLWLEREQKWSGLLIEPNSFMLPALRLVNRKAWIADVCLSITPYPMKVRFTHNVGKHDWNNGQGFIERTAKRDADSRIFAGAVDCFPLRTLLAAINETEVDYISLDIEGVEFKVLRNFPFNQFKIKVMSIEHNLIPEGFEMLKELLTTNGYGIIFKNDIELFAVHKDYADIYKLN